MIKKRIITLALFFILLSGAVLFLAPVAVVVINSFKNKLYIMSDPFALPTKNTADFENYIRGIEKSDLLPSAARSFFITLTSVALIILFSSMAAWFIIRSGSRLCRAVYYTLVFSMVVPFQIVMYTMTNVVMRLGLNTPLGISFVYLGFGAGLSVFMYAGFVKGVPIEIEEAAMIDGCNPLQTFFKIVFPVLKPITVTVAILQTMWVWNDYLLPYLTLGSENKTLPVAIQLAMQGAYGAVDWGSFMAMLVIAIIPIIVFYLFGQKYIIQGVVAGAVKG